MPRIHHPAFLYLPGNKNLVFFIIQKFKVNTMFFDAAKIQKNFTKSKYKLQKVKFNSNLFKNPRSYHLFKKTIVLYK